MCRKGKKFCLMEGSSSKALSVMSGSFTDGELWPMSARFSSRLNSISQGIWGTAVHRHQARTGKLEYERIKGCYFNTS
jgi:hypothetical protein